ncbi:hypothetical protein ON010_g12458 [Phytophthora cinnamomi]|nr:hypothetical protein ON010_g12458 [Phytophthora cinnamomi]
MRLTYFVAVVIGATLHANDSAFASTKDRNQAATDNVVLLDIAHSLEENGDRMLRKVEKNAAEDDIEEEAGTSSVPFKNGLNTKGST